MPSNKKWPSKSLLLCEYIVGTTIPSALGPIPKKPRKKRDVVTVEVFTDDETEEDTVKITYPRSGRSAKPETNADVTVKKVRFEEEPKKSALKKPPASSESEDTPTDSEADIAAESSDSKASEPPSPSKSKNKKNKEKGKEAAKPSDSEDDSEPHPTCECSSCTRGRQKKQREAIKASKKAKQSDSDTEATTNEEREQGQKNGGKKGKAKEKEKAKVDSSGGESQEESAKDTDDSGDEKKKENKQQGKKDKDKNKNANKNEDQAKNGQNKDKNDDKPKDKEPEKEPEKPPTEATEKKASPKEKDSEQKRERKYPTAYPGPHPRRPNLIAPMRAEVVHTERVIETPEDPIPNAYYDAENNIVRIYHGPVYGHHHQSLYPKRDPSLRPLPIGMPHPTQNPYYHGFDRVQDKTGMEHVPITQGMAMPAWNAFAPMGYAGYPGAFPGGPWPHMEPVTQTQNQSQNRGAFSLINPNTKTAGAAPSSQNQDVAGGNNVFPPAKHNSYLPNKTRSQFSAYGGSNGSVRNASLKNPSPAGIENQGQIGQPQQSGWGNGNGNEDMNANGNGGATDGWGNQTQESAWDSNNNGGPSGSQEFDAGDNQESSWNNNNNTGNDSGNNGGSDWPSGGQPFAGDATWENQDARNGNNDNGAQWGDTVQDNNAPSAEAHNNVMPGSWNAPAEAPVWGDATMAASTGGKVDAIGW
ncbi:hypothetical protein J3458_008908 [Metarhizium acridum]|uniref:uncharacterized protein n=1 Tax=Metarhizium acridum TaxID=92637 RepID=UPI001C6AD117|nr:hypothetical protein J3458_008908 [Metarhizium acridum]